MNTKPVNQNQDEAIGQRYDNAMHQAYNQFYGKLTRYETERRVDEFEKDLFERHPEYRDNKWVKMTQECRAAVRPKSETGAMD